MTFFKKNQKLFSIFILVLILLTGCNSGSSNGDDPGSNNGDTFLSGALVDSPVAGIKYVTKSSEGYTDKNGKFEYKEGETVEFYLGSVPFGKAVTGKDVVTPKDLMPSQDEGLSIGALNIARLLQTFDQDGNPDNGITIPKSVEDEFSEINLNFEDNTQFETKLNKALATLNQKNTFPDQRKITEKEKARAHLLQNTNDNSRFYGIFRYNMEFTGNCQPQQNLALYIGPENNSQNPENYLYIPRSKKSGSYKQQDSQGNSYIVEYNTESQSLYWKVKTSSGTELFESNIVFNKQYTDITSSKIKILSGECAGDTKIEKISWNFHESPHPNLPMNEISFGVNDFKSTDGIKGQIHLDFPESICRDPERVTIKIYQENNPSVFITEKEMEYYISEGFLSFEINYDNKTIETGKYICKLNIPGYEELTFEDVQKQYENFNFVDIATCSPSDGSSIDSLTPSFSWSKINSQNDTPYYRLRVYDKNDIMIYQTARVADMTSYKLPHGILEKDSSYSWRLYIYNSSSWTNSDIIVKGKNSAFHTNNTINTNIKLSIAQNFESSHKNPLLQKMSIADVNKDGKKDVFMDSSCWIRNGESFTFNQRISPFKNAGLADLDNDGDIDAFLSMRSEPNQVWLNNGEGNFTNSGQALGNSDSWEVELGDFDKDGDLDAFVANFGPNKIWINNGNGIFTDSGQNLGTAETQGLAMADFDNDGDLDVFCANHYEHLSKLWKNDGNGNFTESGPSNDTEFGKTIDSVSVKAGDLDNDGDIDLFTANATRNTNSVFLNDGKGIFTLSANYGSDISSHSIDLADLDGDGDLDAVIGNTAEIGSDNQNQIWLNNGKAQFILADHQSFSTQDSNHWTADVKFLDLDNDSVPEIITRDSFVNEAKSIYSIWKMVLEKKIYITGLGSFIVNNNTVSYTIENISLPVVVQNHSPSIIDVSIENNKVVITSKKAGNGSFSITDNSGNKETFTFKVIDKLECDKNVLNIGFGQSENLIITGGEKPYTVSVNPSGYVETQITVDSRIIVKAVKKGNTTVTIEDKTGQSCQINIFVTDPMITIPYSENIIIDGKDDDWINIQPFINDKTGDVLFENKQSLETYVVRSVENGTIIIDGNINDWSSIPSAIEDAIDEQISDKDQYINLKNFYICSDDDFIYAMFEVNQEIPSSGSGTFSFEIIDSDFVLPSTTITAHFFSSGDRNITIDHGTSNIAKYTSTEYVASATKFMELKIPKSDLQFSVNNVYIQASGFTHYTHSFDQTDIKQIINQSTSAFTPNENVSFVDIKSNSIAYDKNYLYIKFESNGTFPKYLHFVHNINFTDANYQENGNIAFHYHNSGSSHITIKHNGIQTKEYQQDLAEPTANFKISGDFLEAKIPLEDIPWSLHNKMIDVGNHHGIYNLSDQTNITISTLPLQLSNNQVTVKLGETKKIIIIGGTTPHTFIGDVPEKAELSVLGTVLSVKGKQPGEFTATIKDNSENSVALKITISDEEVDPNNIDNDNDGFTENQGDLNDNDNTIYPGADEICGDGIDQDCNGEDLLCQSAILHLYDLQCPEVVTSGQGYTLTVKYDKSKANFSGIQNPIVMLKVQTDAATIISWSTSPAPTENNGIITFHCSIPKNISGNGVMFFRLVDYEESENAENWNNNPASNIIEKQVKVSLY